MIGEMLPSVIPFIAGFWYWCVLVAVSLGIHVRLGRVQARGRGYWLAGVLLYGYSCMSGWCLDYLAVHVLLGADVSQHPRVVAWMSWDWEAKQRQALVALGYVIPATAPTSAPVPRELPISRRGVLLLTGMRTAFLLVAVGCMWMGLVRITKHGHFGAQATAARCPKCGSTICFEPAPPDQCPDCGLKIRVKRIALTKPVRPPSAPTT